ncbi:Acriflavine sensitivity control protein acr-2 [Escovopsis weberi]|uniref:Acriflavine sensitivity control protein acr-2 n=1 Tax=Escovopsis weberi TaxID=150374 RepID=A0A0M9VV91_ESCWE|nr:Acriflavine sensitivity control protein acr-2 [Escovopsis weberi]
MDAVPPESKACHNCRRQRLRCDRSVPQCRKCLATGKECLGYGKLFRWTGAVASRGKLAGKTSSAPQNNAGSAMGPVARRGPVGLEVSSAPWVLVDPMFQDAGHSHRYYLDYFSNRLCKDLVAHDGPDCNPFRSLVALSGRQPLLRCIIVAASAAHASVLYRSNPACADASRAALTDALVAKHQALRLMASALQDITSIGGDVVLAAALFFVNLELIESGKHGWRAHLEGASRILSLIQHMQPWDSALRDYLLSDCFIYFILATVFTPATQGALNFEAAQIRLVLSKATANSYFSCPPEILEILYAASRLSSGASQHHHPEGEGEGEGEVTAAAIALFNQAQALDVEAWAANTGGMSSLRNVCHRSRSHAGSAHRAAACLYILQAIPAAGEELAGGLADQVREDLYRHLSSIADDDPNFKATSWPTFIAGAEAVDAERRAFIMDRLGRLVCHTPWGFIYTAMDTLPVLWSLVEQHQGSKSWVQILQDTNFNFLIV